MERRAVIEEIAGQRVFRIEDNVGLSFDDYLVANKIKLNDAPVKVYGDRVMPQGGILGGSELRVALELGHIISDPAPAQINNSSIDVRLGHFYYDTGCDNEGQISIYNPRSERATEEFFGELKEAIPLRDALRYLGKKGVDIASRESLEGYAPDQLVIPLMPHQRILAHTLEFIGILPPGTTSMQTRSTKGREGTATCFCAGWGDSGFTNRWTMEFYNLNTGRAILAAVGDRVAQLAFFGTGPVGEDYSAVSGKYQPVAGHNLAEIKRLWRPTMMKPRGYKDVLLSPPIVEGLSEGLK